MSAPPLAPSVAPRLSQAAAATHRGRLRARPRAPPAVPWFHNRHSPASRSTSPLGFALALPSAYPDSAFFSWLRRIDPAFLHSDLPGSWPLDPDHHTYSPSAGASSSSLSSPLPAPVTNTVLLDRLPEDILFSLFDHLPRDAYLNLALTCSLFFRLAHDTTTVSRALRRWFGCTPSCSLPFSIPPDPVRPSLHAHLTGTYTGFAIDRCTNQFDPYPMHLTLPPCPLACTAAYRHLLSSTASHGEGHCHWPSLGNATTRLTSVVHASWAHTDRLAIGAKFMRDRHADALTWTELDLLSPPPPPTQPQPQPQLQQQQQQQQQPAHPVPPLHAAHVNQLALPNTYQALALGPWMLGTFDPAQSQLSRGAFVLLATDAQCAPTATPLLLPAPRTCAAVHALQHGSRITLRGLLANTHAPMSVPNVTLTLTYHDPPLPTLPFRTVLRRPPLLPGPVCWTGSIAVTPGVGAASVAQATGGAAGTAADSDNDPGIMSSSGILLTDHDNKETWMHGIALDVAGCITTSFSSTVTGGGHDEEWHLYASLDHWQAQHDRAEARRSRLGKAKGPHGAGSGGHVSEWSRTYAPLLDRISVRVVSASAHGKAARTRVVGWWKYPTLSCFFAEVDKVEHVEAVGIDSKGKGKASASARVVDQIGLSALGL